MNSIIKTSLHLATALAETCDNPTPIIRLWKAIVETNDVPLVAESHKIACKTLVTVLTTQEYNPNPPPIEPYVLDETILDQIIADIGEK